MSSQTTNWAFPYVQLADAENIETAVKPLSDRLETVFNAVFGGGTLTAAAVRTALGLPAASPGYEIGYDQITSNVAVTSTTESAGTAIITAAAYTFDGSPVIAEFFSPGVTADHTDVFLSLFEGSTQIGRLAMVSSDPADSGGSGGPVLVRRRFTPTAGAHTYKVTAFRSAAQDCTVRAGAGGTGAFLPGYLRFIKV